MFPVLATVHMPKQLPADWPGWLVIGLIIVFAARALLKLLKII